MYYSVNNSMNKERIWKQITFFINVVYLSNTLLLENFNHIQQNEVHTKCARYITVSTFFILEITSTGQNYNLLRVE